MHNPYNRDPRNFVQNDRRTSVPPIASGQGLSPAPQTGRAATWAKEAKLPDDLTRRHHRREVEVLHVPGPVAAGLEQAGA